MANAFASPARQLPMRDAPLHATPVPRQPVPHPRLRTLSWQPAPTPPAFAGRAAGGRVASHPTGVPLAPAVPWGLHQQPAMVARPPPGMRVVASPKPAAFRLPPDAVPRAPLQPPSPIPPPPAGSLPPSTPALGGAAAAEPGRAADGGTPPSPRNARDTRRLSASPVPEANPDASPAPTSPPTKVTPATTPHVTTAARPPASAAPAPANPGPAKGSNPANGKSHGFSPLSFLKTLVQQAGQKMMPSASPSPAPAAAKGTAPPPALDFLPGMEIVHGEHTFTVIAELGAGCFGKVLKVQRVADGKVMALKVQPQLDPRQVMEVQQEVRLLHGLRHPNVVSLFADFPYRTPKGNYICIAMEFCAGGTLKRLIEDRKPVGIPTLQVYGYLAQLADGLAYIHSKGVAHRDLKSENVMITEDQTLKIADFGCGKVVPEGAIGVFTLSGGDLMVIPPEFSAIAQGIPQLTLVSPAYDMWGLGCILSELVTLRLLRQDRCHQWPLSLNPAAYGQLMQEVGQAHQGAFLPLLQRLLQRDPRHRPTAEQVGEYSRQCLGLADEEGLPREAVQQAAELGIGAAECRRAWQLFRQADGDHKGYLTAQELRNLLALLRIATSAAQAIDQHGAPGHGTIDFPGFMAWWAAKDKAWLPTVQPGEPEDLERIKKVFGIEPEVYHTLKKGFQAADIDASGTLSAVALLKVLTEEVGLPLEEPGQLERYLESIGPDWPERAISFDDALHWWRDHVDWPRRDLKAAAAPTGPGTPASSKPAPATPPPTGTARRGSATGSRGGKPAGPPARGTAPASSRGSRSSENPKDPRTPALATKTSARRPKETDKKADKPPALLTELKPEGVGEPAAASEEEEGESPCRRYVQPCLDDSHRSGAVEEVVRCLPHVDIDGVEDDAPGPASPACVAKRAQPLPHPRGPAAAKAPSPEYQAGDVVEVRRSNGGWSKASVTAVTPSGYSILFEDGVGRKEVPYHLTPNFLRRHP